MATSRTSGSTPRLASTVGGPVRSQTTLTFPRIEGPTYPTRTFTPEPAPLHQSALAFGTASKTPRAGPAPKASRSAPSPGPVLVTRPPPQTLESTSTATSLPSLHQRTPKAASQQSRSKSQSATSGVSAVVATPELGVCRKSSAAHMTHPLTLSGFIDPSAIGGSTAQTRARGREQLR